MQHFTSLFTLLSLSLNIKIQNFSVNLVFFSIYFTDLGDFHKRSIHSKVIIVIISKQKTKEKATLSLMLSLYYVHGLNGLILTNEIIIIVAVNSLMFYLKTSLYE